MVSQANVFEKARYGMAVRKRVARAEKIAQIQTCPAPAPGHPPPGHENRLNAWAWSSLLFSRVYLARSCQELSERRSFPDRKPRDFSAKIKLSSSAVPGFFCNSSFLR